MLTLTPKRAWWGCFYWQSYMYSPNWSYLATHPWPRRVFLFLFLRGSHVDDDLLQKISQNFRVHQRRLTDWHWRILARKSLFAKGLTLYAGKVIQALAGPRPDLGIFSNVFFQFASWAYLLEHLHQLPALYNLISSFSRRGFGFDLKDLQEVYMVMDGLCQGKALKWCYYDILVICTYMHGH